MKTALMFLITAACSWGATVCQTINQRLDKNGKEIEVVGHLGGTTYSGFVIYEKTLGAPCEYRWIFSWPSALGLYFEGQQGRKLVADVDARQRAELRYGPKEMDVIVKGRLVTSPDYYVINLPWRPQRPLGKYSHGGFVGFIVVSEIEFEETGNH